MLRYLRLLERITARAPGGDDCWARLPDTERAALRRPRALRLPPSALRPAPRESFHRELTACTRASLPRRASALRASGHRYLTIRGALEGVAASVPAGNAPRLPARPLRRRHRSGRVRGPRRARTVIRNVRPALRAAILFLGRTLGVSLPVDGVFDDASGAARNQRSTRRDVWIFAQILPAFTVKAQGSPPADRWGAVGVPVRARVSPVLPRAMGYPVLRGRTTHRFDAFLGAMTSPLDTDSRDRTRLDHAVKECQVFYEYLQDLFDRVSQREVLKGVPFDAAPRPAPCGSTSPPDLRPRRPPHEPSRSTGSKRGRFPARPPLGGGPPLAGHSFPAVSSRRVCGASAGSSNDHGSSAGARCLFGARFATFLAPSAPSWRPSWRPSSVFLATSVPSCGRSSWRPWWRFSWRSSWPLDGLLRGLLCQPW